MLQAEYGTEPQTSRPPLRPRAGTGPGSMGRSPAEDEAVRPSLDPADLVVGMGGYSIRLARPSRSVHCPLCGRSFLASGPTGFRDEEPICDLCLLEKVEDLGVVLALAAVSRAFATSRYASRAEYDLALGELGAFARIYERVAARSGPPRIFRR